MQSEELPAGIQSITFSHPIWNILVSEEESSLIIDCRNETEKTVGIFNLHLNSLVRGEFPIVLDWWERLIGVSNDLLYSVHYEDNHDPSRHTFRAHEIPSGKWQNVKEVPRFKNSFEESTLFESGTAHHQMVKDFLGLDLPLSCEYFEVEDYIIISYYLRSEVGFNRFLLLIHNGTKQWKVRQDVGMKGFSDGAFFVLRNQLIFVKDRNEVCIYHL